MQKRILQILKQHQQEQKREGAIKQHQQEQKEEQKVIGVDLGIRNVVWAGIVQQEIKRSTIAFVSQTHASLAWMTDRLQMPYLTAVLEESLLPQTPLVSWSQPLCFGARTKKHPSALSIFDFRSVASNFVDSNPQKVVPCKHRIELEDAVHLQSLHRYKQTLLAVFQDSIQVDHAIHKTPEGIRDAWWLDNDVECAVWTNKGKVALWDIRDQEAWSLVFPKTYTQVDVCASFGFVGRSKNTVDIWDWRQDRAPVDTLAAGAFDTLEFCSPTTVGMFSPALSMLYDVATQTSRKLPHTNWRWNISQQYACFEQSELYFVTSNLMQQ